MPSTTIASGIPSLADAIRRSTQQPARLRVHQIDDRAPRQAVLRWSSVSVPTGWSCRAVGSIKCPSLGHRLRSESASDAQSAGSRKCARPMSMSETRTLMIDPLPHGHDPTGWERHARPSQHCAAGARSSIWELAAGLAAESKGVLSARLEYQTQYVVDGIPLTDNVRHPLRPRSKPAMRNR